MTVRVDMLRVQLSATIELLRLVHAECEDLHALAYDRPRAVSEKVRVSAGDYALDTHGDPRARTAYRALSEALVFTAMNLATVAHDCRVLLREGQPTGVRSRRQITTLELAERIAARDQETGYMSVRANAQPDADIALKVAVKELDRLQDVVTKAKREIPKEYRDRVEDPDDRDLLAEVKRLARAIERRAG